MIACCEFPLIVGRASALPGVAAVSLTATVRSILDLLAWKESIVIMAALWYGAGHYVFALWFLSFFFFYLSFFLA